jgi:8-oxo-dGTP pyrophosphatase MutT (NUDIX family)
MTGRADTASDPPAASPRWWVERFPPLRPPASTAGAAVTIVLREGRSDVETLLIQRATNPEDPASGDVALPGGRVDEHDGSLATTALRELREEVGLGEGDLAGPLRYVGTTPAQRFSVHVGVFAAVLSERAPAPSIGSPGEVAAVFWLPRQSLAHVQSLAREIRGATRSVLASVHEGHLVWGFTRRVLREFFDLPRDEASGPAPTSGPGEHHIA